LVLGIGLSLDSPLKHGKVARQPPRVLSTIAELGVKVKPVLLLESRQDVRKDVWHVCRAGRLLVVAERDERSARRVQRVADGLQSLFALFFGAPAPVRTSTCQIPERLVRAGAIDIDELRAVERIATQRFNVITFRNEVVSAFFVSERIMANIFFYLPTICRRDDLYDATHFYTGSVSDCQFLGDDVGEVPEDASRCPVAKENQVKLEGAVLNSFRAVEAVVGEPGKRQERFRQRLLNSGVEPDQQVGYSGEAQHAIIDRIRWLRDLRDATSAHGRRGRASPLTYREVMEAQDVARAVVMDALVHATSEKGRGGSLGERRYLTDQLFGRVRVTGQEGRPVPIGKLVAIPGGLKRVMSSFQGWNPLALPSNRPT
jgi:hypothetical protein